MLWKMSFIWFSACFTSTSADNGQQPFRFGTIPSR